MKGQSWEMPQKEQSPPYPEGGFRYYNMGSERHSHDELKDILEKQESNKAIEDVVDSDGKKLCGIEFDKTDGKLISIKCERYINIEAEAEHLDEIICVTDNNGNITSESLTRSEAREKDRRYLIVTNLIFHGDDILIQKRSKDKKIDPGKLSTSAHGVAKEIFHEDKTRITDGQKVAIINSALEINEELKHDEEPFDIRIWPGTHDELYAYAKKEEINDANTIWLVPEAYIPEEGYPLRLCGNQRTRAVSAGFVFSENKPPISIDPNELEKCEWQPAPSVFKEGESEITEDLYSVTGDVLERILLDSPVARKLGAKFVENLIDRYRGKIKERTD